MSLQSGQRSRKSFGACKTCTHVSYQQISILTLNFNTSFVGNLTNVATLEYFTLTVFFFVFVERCSRVWLGCIERYPWLAVFDENTRVSGHGMLFSWIPRKLSCPWYCCCLVDSGWTSAEPVALSISVFLLSPFLLCLASVCVFGTLERRLACPCASVDTHQSRSVVKFHVAQFQWGFDSELFETVVLQADVVLDCGATETAGGVEAVQILVDAVKQGFSDSRVEVDSLDRPWFRFANGHWGRALSRVWLLTLMGWISIYTLEAENVPVFFFWFMMLNDMHAVSH